MPTHQRLTLAQVVENVRDHMIEIYDNVYRNDPKYQGSTPQCVIDDNIERFRNVSLDVNGLRELFDGREVNGCLRMLVSAMVGVADENDPLFTMFGIDGDTDGPLLFHNWSEEEVAQAAEEYLNTAEGR